MKTYIILAVLVVSAGISRGLGAEGTGGEGHGGAPGGNNEYNRANKITTSLSEAHSLISEAAERPTPGSTLRATGVTQMLASAASDDSVSTGTMHTITEIANEPRRKLLDEVMEDRVRAAMYEASTSIGKAAAVGTVKAGKVASRTGRDMGMAATADTTYFNIDHVPDMGMGGPSERLPGRKLSGTADRPTTETTWSLQNTAEAIAVEGAQAAYWGAINAEAASGKRGNTELTEKMGDAITHQRGVDARSLPRRLKV